CPVRTVSRAAQQATELASGPMLSREVARGYVPVSGIRLAVGLNPTMPHNAAGIRHDPPESVPNAPKAMVSAMDTAAPEEEPPGIRPVARSHGLSGVP